MPVSWVRPHSSTSVIWSLLLAFTFLAGGGGAEGPLQNGLIAAAGAILLCSIAADQLTGRHPVPPDKYVPALVVLTLLAIPLAQLVPLPPQIWQDLPGRESSVLALREVGAANSWRPLSIHPEATMRSAAALLVPLGLFLHILRSSRDENRVNLWIFVASAGISGLIGAGQLALGHPDWLSFYDGPTVGAASGVFANTNHQSLMMVTAMVACGMLIRDPRRVGRPIHGLPINRIIAWGAMLFFALMTLAAGSRAGVMLLSLGLPGALLVPLGKGSFLRWTAAVVGTAAMLVSVILFYPATNSLAVRESFRVGADARYAFLPDILYTLDQFWPLGSGLGTFAEVFAPNENLDFAQRGYVNHAHNDFLEWMIETGLVGGIWLGLAAATLIYGGYRLYRHRSDDLGPAIGGILMLLLVAAHSLVDYPLRTASLAAVAALSIGLFFAGSKEPSQSPTVHRTRLSMAIALLVAAPIAAESLRLFTVQWALRGGQDSIASLLGPGNSDVLGRLAESSLQARRPGEAERLAAMAVQAQPMNSAALRTLAMSREAQNRSSGSAWRLASSLGWRDAPTQLWAFSQGLIENEPEVAALRADALLRTGNPPAEFVQLVQEAASDQGFAAALATRLRVDAPWRTRLFTLVRQPSPRQVIGTQSVLRQLARTGDKPNRADGRSLISYFLENAAYGRAIEIDRLVAGDRTGDGNYMDDGNFSRSIEDYARDSTPFDWALHKGNHTVGSIDPTPPSYLGADTDGERSEPAASRYVHLPPRQYRLSYQVRSDESDAFRMRVFCVNRYKELGTDSAPRSNSFSSRTFDFAVEKDCSLIRLLVESVGSGRVATAGYDNITIVGI